MNILPKKSWHVRNKDNVARVRKDEAQAAEEERVRRKRADLAEQEARTDFLRKKARVVATDDDRALVKLDRDSDHVNLFQDVEEGKGTNKGNQEYEDDKRKEKERQEKALGILTYLGQSASESQTCRPWYQEAPARGKPETDDAAKNEKHKSFLDPIHEMERYLQKKTGEKRKPRHGKEHKKEKRKETNQAVKPSIEQMRQERLKREAAEKSRAAALLSGKKETPVPEQEMDDRKRRYNSQFNPQFARKPKLQDDTVYPY